HYYVRLTLRWRANVDIVGLHSATATASTARIGHFHVDVTCRLKHGDEMTNRLGYFHGRITTPPASDSADTAAKIKNSVRSTLSPPIPVASFKATKVQQADNAPAPNKIKAAASERNSII